MFRNISFTFLCALAFISWSLLCYLHAIEKQQNDTDYDVELYTEHSTFTEAPYECPQKFLEPSFRSRLYDMLISYGLVVALTVALSRLLQFVELQISSGLQRHDDHLPFKLSLPCVLNEPKDLSIVNTIQEVELVKQLWHPEQLWQTEDLSLSEQLSPQVQLSPQEQPTSQEQLTLPKQLTLQEQLALPEQLTLAEQVTITEQPVSQENFQQQQQPEPRQSSALALQEVILREQLGDLQIRCCELLQELRSVSSIAVGPNINTAKDHGSATAVHPTVSSSRFSGSESEDLAGAIMWKQPDTMRSSEGSMIQQVREPQTTTVTQNVFVTHSHIHFNFNGSVHLTEQNLNVGMLPSKIKSRCSEFLQVWGTYIKGPHERPMLTGINNILSE